MSVVNSVGDADILDVNESGWYGFCFGSRKGRSCCSCSVSLFWKSNDRVIHTLPFQVNGKFIFSVDYGRLLFLRPGSAIGIRWNDTTTCPNHVTNPSDLQWKLVLKQIVSSSSLSSENELRGGELSDRAKCIVCSTCCRTFAQVQSAQTHYNDHHKELSPLWRQPLTIVYQDDVMAVVDKPQGISVQGGNGKTLQRSDLLLPLAAPDGRKPIIVHRLDAATGGLLVLAKTKESERHLRMAFAQQLCHKRYRAVAFGRVEADSGVIHEPVSGKPAETRYQVILRVPCNDPRANGWITIVDLFPVSGRKHQIRRHLKHIGHPIWGDKRYSCYTKDEASPVDEELSEDDKLDLLFRTTVEQNPHSRLCLWAMEISLPHPETNVLVTIGLAKEPEWISQLVTLQKQLVAQSLSTSR
jgi:23S rRNA-/tRNA-specific pseudouridylate synthase